MECSIYCWGDSIVESTVYFTAHVRTPCHEDCIPNIDKCMQRSSNGICPYMLTLPGSQLLSPGNMNIIYDKLLMYLNISEF